MFGSNLEIIALTAVNLNTKYLSCVPFFIEFWLSLKSRNPGVRFTPKVLIVAQNLPTELERYRPWCQVIGNAGKLPSAFYSQAVRLYQPSLENCDLVLTTDVDMFPMGDKVIEAALEKISQGAKFVVCRDVLPNGQFPMCYNLAAPETWQIVSKVRTSEQVKSALESLFEETSRNITYEAVHGGEGWFTDQQELFRLVTDFEKFGGAVARLKDRDTGHRRLDRSFYPFPLNWLSIPLVALGHYSDYHVHHPASKHKIFIQTLLRIGTRVTH